MELEVLELPGVAGEGEAASGMCRLSSVVVERSNGECHLCNM